MSEIIYNIIEKTKEELRNWEMTEEEIIDFVSSELETQHDDLVDSLLTEVIANWSRSQ